LSTTPARAETRARLGHVPALDGLRGVAIAIVVAYHAFGFPLGGWLGVDLFFVLSGFLITTLLLEEHAATGAVRLRAFYVRRARRLLPALAVLLAAYVAISGIAGLGVVARFGFYTGNVYEAFVPGAAQHLVGLNHLWSLAQEEQFYLVWPAALLLAPKVRRPVLVLATIAAALMVYRLALAGTGASDARIYFAPDTNVDGLLLGAALAFRPFAVPRRFVVLASAVGAVLSLLIPQSTALGVSATLPLAELAAVVLIAAAVDGTLRLPRPLIWLGGISYSLYLWHYLVLWAFQWQQPLLAVAVSVAAAYASTVWIERPFRRRRAPAPQMPAKEWPFRTDLQF
jgi:peptidoglycan/LPS O-acetylase OafA/YrhL